MRHSKPLNFSLRIFARSLTNLTLQLGAVARSIQWNCMIEKINVFGYKFKNFGCQLIVISHKSRKNYCRIEWMFANANIERR